MAEKKIRHGRIKPNVKKAIPKPLCPKCGEIMVRTYIRGNAERKRAYIGMGWSCPSSSCDYIVKDYVDVDLEEETESMNELEND